MLNYVQLTQQQYVDYLINLISTAEGQLSSVTNLGDGQRTIGYGYTFGRNNNLALWQAAGIVLTPTDISALQSIDAALTLEQKNTIAEQQFARTLSKTEATALLRQTYPEYEAPANNLEMLLSVERAAFVSVTYNRGVTVVNQRMTGFFDAIRSRNRAEAWFELRYNANALGLAAISGTGTPKQLDAIARGEDRGIAKRRFWESQAFGLYDDPSNVTADEAKQVYRMLQLRRTAIVVYDDKYGGQVGNANIDYSLAGTPNVVLTLVNSLLPAQAAFVADLRNRYLSLSTLDPNDFISTNIYLDPGRDSSDSVATFKADHSATLISTQYNSLGNEVGFRDILIGEGGVDYLLGGKGDDILLGGTGDDVYYYRPGDGNDLIVEEREADGKIKGRIVLRDVVVDLEPRDLVARGLFLEVAGLPNTWVTPDGAITLTHNSPWKLAVPDGGEISLGEDFASGDFGIQLKTLPADEPTTRSIVGDLEPIDFDPNAAGVQTQTDDLGNVITDPNVPALNRADLLNGSAGADLIQSGDGLDRVTAGEGADQVQAGTGRDFVYGEGGNDFLEGGADGDVLSGGDGEDRLYAGARGSDALTDISTAIAAGSGVGTGLQGDWLAGGAGDDILIGGADDDVLTGGTGADLLIGGAGADNLLGDSDYLAASLNWSFTDAGGVRLFSPVVGETDPLGGAADNIYGGSGDDFIRGGRGDDVIYGEADNDDISGEAGADVIFGGDGNDNLSGDAPYIAGAEHGADYLDGGAGNDTITGDGGADVIFGGTGEDVILGDGAALDAAFHGGDYIDGGDDDALVSVAMFSAGLRRASELSIRTGRI